MLPLAIATGNGSNYQGWLKKAWHVLKKRNNKVNNLKNVA